MTQVHKCDQCGKIGSPFGNLWYQLTSPYPRSDVEWLGQRPVMDLCSLECVEYYAVEKGKKTKNYS